MAINSTTTGPLRTAAIFLSSGTFIPPTGVTRAFVSILGASGGQGNIRRYRQAGAGGGGVLAAGWVQVVPGQPHAVTVGAGGAGGPSAPVAQAGSTGGQSVFDGSLIANGGAGSAGAFDNSQSAGAAGSASAETALPTINPSASTLARVTSFVSQTTSGQVSGYVTANDRYGPNQQTGGSGLSAKVYIFI
jgi:hypothetical protein